VIRRKPSRLLVVFWLTLGLLSARADSLAEGFLKPPDAARMWTWWFWLGDQVDKESITADLEALQAQGLGGVTVYSLSGPGVEGRGPAYLSPAWRELFKHTLKEAGRLGLGVSTMLCSGWNAGGPWIKPEQACKRHVYSQLVLVGPQHFKSLLPQPPSDPRYYRDVAVQAFRLAAPPGKPDGPLSKPWACKTLDDAVEGNAATQEINEAPRRPWPPATAGTAIQPAEIIDLTARCSREGILDWPVPAGTWMVVRTGYTLTGAMTTWSSPTGGGLEADPLDAAAMDVQFANAVAPLVAEAGPLAGKVLRSVQIDSWEINHPNWSARFPDEFQKLRGYDPRPYLPALAGFVIGSDEITERFLYDYRKTVGDCVADNYYGRLSQRAARHGLVQQSEAGGICHPKTMALDGLKNLGRCAIPMGEFWQDDHGLEANQNKNGKQTASAAHLYGRRIAAAEAFTSFLQWTDSPASLKPTADRAFCEGFNHFFIFSSATHRGDGWPGTEYCAGTHFNRKITWWRQARGFSDYIARCSHMLQQGLFVADVLFYNGDGCPNFVPPKHSDPSLGSGYDYDVCNTEVLLTRLAVKEGRLVLPDGMRYRLLVLPERRDMPVDVLRKLKTLVTAGLTLIGPKPAKDPGLKDYPHCDAEVQHLADQLWGAAGALASGPDGPRNDAGIVPAPGGNKNAGLVRQRPVGRGRVICGPTARAVLQADGVLPDVDFDHRRPDACLDWIHRRADGAEIYFIANRNNHSEQATVVFRVSGRPPELWDPVTGTIRRLPDFHATPDGRTAVPLQWASQGSFFVVFPPHAAREPNAKPAGTPNFPEWQPMETLAGGWAVHFDPPWDGPAEKHAGGSRRPGLVLFEQLEDWTRRTEEDLKYFSGTATYRKVFDLSPEVSKSHSDLRFSSRAKASSVAQGAMADKTEDKLTSDPSFRLCLDLGDVRNLATVRLNGRALGTLWTPPFRVEITGVARPAGNELEIEVVNLWPNRLIGDARLPPEQRRTATNVQTITKDSPLLPAGLLGPVTVQAAGF